MSKNILRNFLYLDIQLVDDYLSSLEGALFEETLIEKEQNVTEGGGGIDLQVIKGSGKKEKSKGLESIKKINLTDAGKFQKLYEILKDDNFFEYYENMNLETWEKLDKNSVLECMVNLRFAKIEGIIDTIQNLLPLMSILENTTSEPIIDKKSQEAINGINMLAEQNRGKGLPCVFTFTDNDEFKFISYLNPNYLRVSKEQVIGELNLFCKIQRKLHEDEKIELFKIVPSLDIFKFNKQQKINLKNVKIPDDLKDTIKSPAAIVIPIAIFR